MNNKICVIGLGYVGLPLEAVSSSKYNVVGLDIYQERIIDIYNPWVDKEEVKYEYNLDLINTGDTIVFDIKSIVDGRL